MSRVLTEGAEALGEAEAKLKALASDAISGNEWEAVATLAAWARGVRELLNGAGVTSAAPTAATVPPRTSPARAPADVPLAAVAGRKQGNGSPRPIRQKVAAAPPTRTGTVRGGAARKGVTYPRFLRDGDALVKIGWSKKGKSEYEHRAPREVVDQIVGAIRQLASEGPRFTVESLLAAIAASGTEVPSYQTYLCIAWMRENDLLEQHGRQGYSVVRPAELRDRLTAAWNATRARA